MFPYLKKLILNCIWKYNGTKIAKTLKKEKEVEEFVLPVIKYFYKTHNNKVVWYSAVINKQMKRTTKDTEMYLDI